MQKLIRILLVLGFLSAYTGCARNPVTGKRQIVLVSESEEVAMGQQSDRQVRQEYGVVENQSLQNYIQAMGRKLVAVSHRPQLEWHFTVVDSPVVNAFAIPGGYVYLTRGILVYLGSEAELAGVMGHEIGHVTARHAVGQITREQLAQIGMGIGGVLSPAFGQLGNAAQSGLGLVFLRFSRDDEREADRLGVEYAARAACDPRQVSNFFDILGRLTAAGDRETIPGWLSTHPDPPERVQTTRKLADEWIQMLGLTEERMIVNRDQLFRAIDGIVFGNDPREGFSEGNHFYHPRLEFELDFPAQWRVDNTRNAVLAVAPQQAAQLELTMPGVRTGTTPEDYMRTLVSRGLMPQSVQSTSIDGYPAVLANYVLRTQRGPVGVRAAFIQYRDRILQIAGVALDFNRHGPEIERSIRSFKKLTDPKILNAQPDRVKIQPAREGETLALIARRTNNPRVSAADLAVLNRLAVSQPISEGRLLKIVAPGY
jgi:predicted Zn-dependent protease